MATIEIIKASLVYKEIMRDSFGGIMYNVANRGKYQSGAIEALWYGLNENERSAQNGIIKGVFNFLKEYEV